MTYPGDKLRWWDRIDWLKVIIGLIFLAAAICLVICFEVATSFIGTKLLK